MKNEDSSHENKIVKILEENSSPRKRIINPPITRKKSAEIHRSVEQSDVWSLYTDYFWRGVGKLSFVMLRISMSFDRFQNDPL